MMPLNDPLPVRRTAEPVKRGQLTTTQKVATGGGAALAMAALLAILPIWEGKSNKPYRDVVGVMTVCYGETAVPMRTYSDAECMAMLEDRAGQFLEAVRRINPTIVDDPEQWAAHASLAYNIGTGAYQRSSVARLYKVGREREACQAIGRYRLAGGKVWRGLVLRRNGDAGRLGEIELCVKGV